MDVLAITQARIGSTRFPGKILKKVQKVSLLEIHLIRILKSKVINKLKVATTSEPEAIKIVEICNSLNIETFRGSVENVLERFYHTAKTENPQWVVRLTSDCPLIDPLEIDRIIQYAVSKNLDYVSNTLKPTFPDGFDIEVFKFSALEKAYKDARTSSDLEHVTPYIWRNSSFMGESIFSSDCVMNDSDFSDIRLTVDTLEDFKVIEKLVEQVGIEKSWQEYTNIIKNNIEIKNINAHLTRNEGFTNSLKRK